MEDRKKPKRPSDFEADMEQVRKDVESGEEFAYPGRRTLLSAQKLKQTLEEIKVPALEVIKDEQQKPRPKKQETE